MVTSAELSFNTSSSSASTVRETTVDAAPQPATVVASPLAGLTSTSNPVSVAEHTSRAEPSMTRYEQFAATS